VVLPVLQLVTNFNAQNQRNNYVFHNYGHVVLDPLPQNSVLLLRGHIQLNVPLYLHACEGVRPDLEILNIDQIPDFNITEFTYKINGSKDIFYMAKEYDNIKCVNCGVLPFGIVNKVIPLDLTSDLDPFEWEATIDAVLPHYTLYNHSLVKYPENSWEHIAALHYWHAFESKATYLIYVSSKFEGPMSEPAVMRAIETLQNITSHFPGIQSVYRDLGFSYEKILSYHPTSMEFIALIVDAWGKYLQFPKIDIKEYKQIQFLNGGYKKTLVSMGRMANM